MSTKLPPDENSSSSPLQHLAIAVGTLLVITLTVLAAIFLAMQDVPDQEQPTAIVASTPTIIRPLATPTSLLPSSPAAVASPTFTPTLPPPATATPSATPLPSLQPTDTPLPPTSTLPPTDTPLPPPPTATSTPEIPTPTPEPAPATPQAPPGGACQPPPTWIAYTVQTPEETLNLLAERTNSSPYELYQVNCLDSYTIRPGQVIYLPFLPPTSTVTHTPTPVTPSPTPTRTDTPTATPRAPEIFSSEPGSGVNTEEVIIAVQGRYFYYDESDGFRVELRRGGSKQGLLLGELKTNNSFEAIVPIGLLPGTYDLWVINPDDQFDVRSSAYTAIEATPTLTP
ncbi:MAG: LysM peptidoglycan-binding domain-containing protein [Anaerolineae bacterium]|nr:LysM peptidoglycan-binding domain-containing protein [Anaerolineae bacterium]